MTNRRAFIAGILAAGLIPKPTWAEAGNPAFLSAGKKPDGGYVLCGLNSEGLITFERPLPVRGHAAAAHPTLAEAVAFARRPGTYAIVLDCVTGRQKTRLEAPLGRHFYGHGTYAANGELLFTTENDIDTAMGVVGVWDARNEYTRIGEFSSGGIGPHDIKLMPDGKVLVIANGGIETHPETGRLKLNIPMMRSNLSYLDLNGQVLSQFELDAEHQKNSIRHLAVSLDGTVAFAMQWQGDLNENLPLLGIHSQISNETRLISDASILRMSGYLGSVAVTGDGRRIMVTSPRAGLLQQFVDTELDSEVQLRDVCGVAASNTGFMVTTGTGLAQPALGESIRHPVAWDNHLVPIY